MKISNDPLRLVLGGILLVLGVLALLNITVVPGIIFTVVGIITGALLVIKTKYL